jgi:hypothetical protein
MLGQHSQTMLMIVLIYIYIQFTIESWDKNTPLDKFKYKIQNRLQINIVILHVCVDVWHDDKLLSLYYMLCGYIR